MSRQRIQAILDGEDPVFGRSVAFFLQGLILVSVVTIALETMPAFGPAWHGIFLVEEWVIVGVFSAEYLLRLYAAPRRLGYVFSFFGIIDLISILPTLLLLGYDVRSIRALRVLRVLRLLKLARYVRALERLGRAVRTVGDELVVFAAVAIIVLYLCATGIYFFEHDAQPEAFGSIPDAMWWAVVTLTTVGYGDVYPITAGGRLFTGLMLMLALGVIAVPTGLVSSALSSGDPLRSKEDEE
ncbi:ion transporter [Acuticoccus mangrovi]|uniref:Ion transporter n=1 Tax=Acuticoccus mangrovi TaxID=2796142 RepID=A0A934IP50_9HYPH|nr:ion transporter [Acuticoccus mangrovi]MBJ3777467.1 ion transporter [Acuticoccus mangrovi]